MLRPLCVLLLVSWNHQIDCADTDVARAGSHHDGGFARNWRLMGNKVVKWQTKFNPHKQFFYLTYDPKNDYCEITQVPTESPDPGTLTCQYKFQADEKDLYIYNLKVPNKAEKNDWIEFSYSNAKSRAKNSWYIAPMNFTRCRDKSLRKSAGGVAAAPTAPTGELKTTTIPIVNITSTLTSEANGRKSACQVNDDRTQIMCTQSDASGKVLLNGEKYELPKNWKADWLRIHNLKNSGKILLVYGECPNGKCHEFSAVRLQRERSIAFVAPKLDLQCEEVEAKLTFDVADIPGGLCVHMVCSKDHYNKDSKVKTESLLQYRRFCIYGDLSN